MTDDFYRRLFRFYAVGAQNQFGAMSPIWEAIFRNHHKALAAALVKESIADARAVLESGTDCLAGIAGTLFSGSENSELNEQLRTVATCLGLRPLANPNQPAAVDGVDNNSLLTALEAYFCTKRSLPIPWLSRDSAACPFRFPTCAYAAGSIFMFLGYPPASVIEIGPGFGLIGLMLRGLGCRRYTVVDLPIGAVIIAWVLATVLGEDQIRLSGECESEAYAWIFAPDAIERIVGVYDVVINSDSFPEIPAPCQDAYIKLAQRCLFSEGFIYSVNQESANGGQRSIYRAMRESTLFRCAVRKIFPLRPGYIEEIFTI